jgi:hypothetical protein
MVYLGGGSPRRRNGPYLHDPPPGYRPPRLRTTRKEQQRKARQDWVLMRVGTVILVPTAVALLVLILVMIVTHG